MTTPQHSYYGISPQDIELVMRAARAERARTVGRALRWLFRWRRKDDAWLDGKAPALSFNPYR